MGKKFISLLLVIKVRPYFHVVVAVGVTWVDRLRIDLMTRWFNVSKFVSGKTPRMSYFIILLVVGWTGNHSHIFRLFKFYIYTSSILVQYMFNVMLDKTNSLWNDKILFHLTKSLIIFSSVDIYREIQIDIW